MKRIFRLNLGARGVKRDVDSELAFHIEMRTREFIEQGLSPADARRAAERAFGDRADIEAELRTGDTRRAKERERADILEGIAQDLRFAVRTLRKSPGYTIAAVLTLALGIGANTAIFSVIDGVLLRRLPYDGGERLVELHQPSVKLNGGDVGFAALEVADYQKMTRTLEGVVEYHSMSFNLYGQGEPLRVRTGVVSAAFFQVMGVRPMFGRTFLAGEDAKNALPVLVLSHAFWKNTLGGDPAIVGKTFVMNDRVHTVVGVLPPLPGYPDDNDVYMPVSSCPFRSAPEMEKDHAMHMVGIFARARPGVSQTAIDSDLGSISRRLYAEYPGDYPPADGLSVTATPLHDALTRDARPTFLVLLATAGLVLLIACANVANLTFARVLRRERELAVRSALGAGRGRLVRQLLTESTLLSLAGGALGLAIAWGSVGLLTRFAARLTARASEIGIDGRVLLFTLGASVMTGIVLGLLPALPSRGDLVGALKDGGASATASAARLRMRGALIVSQVAVAFTLLIGAGLMLRSLYNLERVNPGFDPENVLTLRIDLNWTKYDTPLKSRAFYHDLLDRVQAMTGVKSAGLTNKFPLNESGPFTVVFHVDGRAEGEGQSLPKADYHVATTQYLQTMGVPLLRGRGFTDADRLDAPHVAVINQSLARHLWPDADPIGARVSADNGPEKRWSTVIGVVGDVKQYGLAKDAVDEIYVPFEQTTNRGLGSNVVIRTTGDPSVLARRVIDAAHAIDPTQPVYGVATMEQLRHDSLASPRVMTTLLSLFAALALVITATGLAGVIAFTVGQRTHEIGIRMALGAERGEVLSMVVRQGMRLVVGGLAIGAIVAVALSRLMSGILFGIRPTDPFTFAGVFVMLAAVALAACLVPARRATRIDPIIALRSS